MLYAVQPERLLVAQIMRLDLRNQGRRIVAAALRKAGTARACAGVFVLNENLNRVDAGGIVRADRRTDDDKLMGTGGAHAQVRLRRNDKRTDVQARSLLMRHPVRFGLDERLDRLHKILNLKRRDAHALVGVDHTLRVLLRAEQLNRTIRRAVRLEALKGLHCIVVDHCGRIKRQRLIRHNARVMPARLLGVVNDQHMVGENRAKAQVGFVRLCLWILRQFILDVEHLISLFSIKLG